MPSKRNATMYHCYCFNCGYSRSLSNFLREFYPDVHRDFILKKSRTKLFNKNKLLPDAENVVIEANLNGRASKLIDLPTDHPAVEYLESRKIPNVWKRYLFYTDNFKELTNGFIPNKFEKVEAEDNRLIIPFYTKKNKRLFAMAGRSMTGKKPKYLTIKFDEFHDKIFGLDITKFEKRVYVFEGQFDSMFIPNSIAMGGSISNVKKLLEHGEKEKFILVPDLEPRNKEICNMIETCIRHGFGVSLLPMNMKKYGKDINDFVKEGFSGKYLKNIIDENVKFGLSAKMAFASWKVIK